MLMQMQIDDGDYKEMMMRTGPRATVVESSIKEWSWRNGGFAGGQSPPPLHRAVHGRGLLPPDNDD